MKNFRKVLALVLVVATLFSFVAMASAKTLADYSDAADVQYKEAVDVLTAIGILKGYDGKYHANDPIDRDEIAKMIAVLRNAGVDNSALFTGANTFADVKGTWAEGYIAYAAQVGIVNGRNATTFDPDAKVTGTEVLKMLLCVLGYDAKLQGYVGANWQVNVMRDAVKMGLTEGLTNFDPYAPATRDEAAQMMFNALLAPMVVGYISENIVKVTNSIYTEWPNIATPDTNHGYEVAYCNAVLSSVPLFTIIDGLFVVVDTNDCYMRPGHTWVYGDDYESFWVDAYNAKQNKGGLDADLVAEEIYVDGKLTEVDDVVTGNGVVVEYYDAVTVVINTFIAKVGTVNEYYNYFTLVNDNDEVLAKYALDGRELAAGDVVLYWTCNDGLHDIKVITGKSVAISEGVNYKDWDSSYIVADGATYNYAATLGFVLDSAENMDRLVWADIEANGEKYDLYFDDHGFIKYYAPTAAAATEYFYTYIVEGTVKSHNHGWATNANGVDEEIVSYTADFVDYGTDGKLTVADDVASDLTVKNAVVATGTAYGMGALVKAHKADDVVVADASAAFATIGTELNKDSYKLGNGLYATSKTVFMIRTMNLDGTYTYEQVTGYKNLKGNYVAVALDQEKTNIQYFTTEGHEDDTFVSYVFIDAVWTRDFDATFLTLGEADYYAFKTDLKNLYADDYTAYTVWVNGEEAVVLIDKDEAPLAKVTKYEATLAYINVAITVDGKDLPIYALVEETGVKVADPAIACWYEVVEGETYIRFADTNEVYMLADGALVLTLTANLVDGVYVTDVYEGILALENGSYIEYAYVTIDGDYVTEIIRVDPLFVENI